MRESTWSTTQPEIFYWRRASGQEVDVVLEDRAGRVVGVEVKAAATLSSNDVRGLQALATAAGKHWVRGVVLYAGTEVIPFSANLHGVPTRAPGRASQSCSYLSSATNRFSLEFSCFSSFSRRA